MRCRTIHKAQVQALLLASLFVSGQALAEKPDWAGDNRGDRHEQKSKHRGDRERGNNDDYRRDDERSHVYFGDRHRVYVHEYFTQHYSSGRCPPGLAKRHNGCMPPGQARKWRIGRPLPRDVVYYDLPPAVVVELGVPLPRHRYVRVAGDILLIAIGTGMVVDAIEDLGGR